MHFLSLENGETLKVLKERNGVIRQSETVTSKPFAGCGVQDSSGRVCTHP